MYWWRWWPSCRGGFPSQSTRPLFSTIYAVISAPLVSTALWTIALGATEDDCIRVSLSADSRNPVVHLGEQQSLEEFTPAHPARAFELLPII